MREALRGALGVSTLTHKSAADSDAQTGATMTPERSAMVTGAARGIGKAIAERLAADGLGGVGRRSAVVAD